MCLIYILDSIPALCQQFNNRQYSWCRLWVMRGQLWGYLPGCMTGVCSVEYQEHVNRDQPQQISCLAGRMVDVWSCNITPNKFDDVNVCNNWNYIKVWVIHLIVSLFQLARSDNINYKWNISEVKVLCCLLIQQTLYQKLHPRLEIMYLLSPDLKLLTLRYGINIIIQLVATMANFQNGPLHTAMVGQKLPQAISS